MPRRILLAGATMDERQGGLAHFSAYHCGLCIASRPAELIDNAVQVRHCLLIDGGPHEKL